MRLGTVLHGVLRDIEGAVTQDLSSSDVAFHALRDYVPGDDRRALGEHRVAAQRDLGLRELVAAQPEIVTYVGHEEEPVTADEVDSNDRDAGPA